MEPQFGVGVEFDGLHVDRYIDEGRSGSVWKVHEIAAPENVWAVKIHLGAYVNVRKSRFRREVKFVRRDYIREHRPKLIRTGCWNGHHYYMTEYGTPLPEEYTPRLIIRTFLPIARALAALHRRGFLHCDIKPGNIVLVNGVPKLIDYGCVTTIRAAELKPRCVGTMGYIPPEVREGMLLNVRAEVCAFGYLLHWACRSARCRRTFGPLILYLTNREPIERPASMDYVCAKLPLCRDWLMRLAVILLYLFGAPLLLAIAGIIIAEIFEARFERWVEQKNRDYIRDNAFRITAEYMKNASGAPRRDKDAPEAPAPRDSK